MGRWAREKTTPNVKPVEKVELSEKNVGLRIAVCAILLAIGVSSIAYGVRAWLSTKEGWTQIAADSGADTNIGNEFVFMYNLGSGELSAKAEQKVLINLYTEIMVEAYKNFHINQDFEQMHNIYYVNHHPNEEIQVSDMLYQAFEIIAKYDDRRIYLAPIYGEYDEIFRCQDDSELIDYDPILNPEVADFYKEIAAFAMNEEAISIRLLGDSKICLQVSEEYLTYCNENGIKNLIDFSWMRNAFVVDYLAQELTKEGLMHGSVSSYDGYTRNLNPDKTQFSLPIYDLRDDKTYQVATMQYTSARSIVELRSYPMNTLDNYRFYELKNGEIRTMYLDVRDGISKYANEQLYSYSDQLGCADILLQIAPIYIAEDIKQDVLSDLIEKDIFVIYCNDSKIMYTDKELQLEDVYNEAPLSYTVELMK